MVNRDAQMLWSIISSLVNASLGLALLADLDCADVITNMEDRHIASGATSTATVSLLRQAVALLPHLKATEGQA